jgi:hypothetical protein
LDFEATASAPGVDLDAQRAQHLAVTKSAPARRHHFDRSTEFPNYFLDPKYRSLPPDQIPAKELKKVRAFLEGMVASRLRRLTVPVLREGWPEPRLLRYFDVLTEELRAIDPGVEIIPAGGPVRHTLAKIYEDVYRKMEADPQLTRDQVFEQLEAEAKIGDDVPVDHVIGKGGDIDVLFISSDPERFDQALTECGTTLTNRAIETLASASAEESAKRMYYLRGDTKPYAKQMKRNEPQGGSQLDHLGFSLGVGEQPAGFKEPPARRCDTSIVEDFIKGWVRFLPPESATALAECDTDPDKLTIRTPRVLLEIPFLAFHPRDEEAVEDSIAEARARLERGKLPENGALEQFIKLEANALFGGAKNRLIRSAPGSVEHQFLEYAMALSEKLSRQLINEFVDTFEIQRERRALNGLPPELLIPGEELVSSYTDNGEAHHGTPSLAGVLGVLGGNMYVSGGFGREGIRDSDGRGGNLAKDRALARSFAGDDGYVVTLKLRPEVVPYLNVLDLGRLNSSEKLRSIEAAAKRDKRNLIEVLVRDHGIDVIVSDGVVLAQNMAAWSAPSGPEGFLSAQTQVAFDTKADYTLRLKAAYLYENLGPVLRSMGKPTEPVDTASLVEQGLRAESTDDQVAALTTLQKLAAVGWQPPAELGALADAFAQDGQPAAVRVPGLALFAKRHPDDAALPRTLLAGLSDPNDSVQRTAVDLILSRMDPLEALDAHFPEDFRAALKNVSENTLTTVTLGLGRTRPKSLEYAQILRDCLESKHAWFNQLNAAHSLAYIGMPLPADIVTDLAKLACDPQTAPRLRIAAAQAMAAAEPQAREHAAQALAALASKAGEDMVLRRSSMNGLGRLGVHNAETDAAVAIGLQDLDTALQSWSLKVILSAGTLPRELRPFVNGLTGNRNDDLARQVLALPDADRTAG